MFHLESSDVCPQNFRSLLPKHPNSEYSATSIPTWHTRCSNSSHPLLALAASAVRLRDIDVRLRDIRCMCSGYPPHEPETPAVLTEDVRHPPKHRFRFRPKAPTVYGHDFQEKARKSVASVRHTGGAETGACRSQHVITGERGGDFTAYRGGRHKKKCRRKPQHPPLILEKKRHKSGPYQNLFNTSTN